MWYVFMVYTRADSIDKRRRGIDSKKLSTLNMTYKQ